MAPSKIISVTAREILDSRSNPTIEVELATNLGTFYASVPSGVSTGSYEALELRDGDPKRFGGKGVLKAVENLVSIVAPKLIGLDPREQEKIDNLMVHELDGTQNEWGWCKKKLGANTILAASMAVCRAGACAATKTLYEHIATLAGRPTDKFTLPVPAFNVINGGRHGGNKLAMQEFMVLPVGAKSFADALRFGSEVYNSLKEIIKKKYGVEATNVGDEGGFAPGITDSREALELLTLAISEAGLTGTVKIAMDIAAGEFFDEKAKKYLLDFKHETRKPENAKTGAELIELYKGYCKAFDIVSIEDPFDQDDWASYAKMTAETGPALQVMGDDLLATNPKRIQKGIDQKACNSLLLKLNQIGSVTESIKACQLAQKAGWTVMVSHRSGETEDTFIADLVVGLGTRQIKSGAPCRAERVAKYNQLLRIAERLKEKGTYAGENFRNTK